MNAVHLVWLIAAGCVAGVANAQPGAAVPAAAASAPAPSFAEVLKKYAEVDLSVPESPAFAILGLTPSGVQRPGTPRELASSLTKGFDKDGTPQTGLAIDFAPLPLFAQELIVGGKTYEDDLLIQILTRTTVSLATADATGGASQQAWGLRIGLLDRGDPGLYSSELVSCIQKTVTLPPVPGGMDVEAAPPDVNASIRKAIASCDPTQRIALWAKPALYVGFGQSWYSSTGALKDRAPAANAFWATYSVGRSLGSVRSLLLLHVERKSDQRTPDPADATRLLRQDSKGLTARLRFGAPKWHAFLDAGRSWVAIEGQARSKVRHVGVGAEFQMKDDLWLQLGNVSEKGYQDGSDRRQVTAGIRFGAEPFLASPGPAK